MGGITLTWRTMCPGAGHTDLEEGSFLTLVISEEWPLFTIHSKFKSVLAIALSLRHQDIILRKRKVRLRGAL